MMAPASTVVLGPTFAIAITEAPIQQSSPIVTGLKFFSFAPKSLPSNPWSCGCPSTKTCTSLAIGFSRQGCSYRGRNALQPTPRHLASRNSEQRTIRKTLDRREHSAVQLERNLCLVGSRPEDRLWSQ